MSDFVIPPTVSPYSTGLDASDRSLAEMFPPVDPEFEPYGSRVLVQVRRVVSKSSGGIILSSSTKESEAWNMNVAKLLKCGPLAFRNRSTGEPWSEGLWASPGDFVRIAKYGGDRWSVEARDGLEPVVLMILNDADLLGRVLGNPCAVRAYIS